MKQMNSTWYVAPNGMFYYAPKSTKSLRLLTDSEVTAMRESMKAKGVVTSGLKNERYAV